MNKDSFNLLLEQGESYNIEFKEKLSGIEKEICAFANASGGKILLGIADDGSIKGLEKKKINKIKSEIQDTANNIQPGASIEIDKFSNIIIITVKKGETPPYQCSSGFFLRIGPNSQKMKRNEIISMIMESGAIRFDEQVNTAYKFAKYFDKKKLKDYMRLAGISTRHKEKDILINLGVYNEDADAINNAGLLFFSKKIEPIFFHTPVTCVLFKGIDKVNVIDKKDFNEDFLSMIDGAMKFLKQHIPVKQVMTGEPKRLDIPEIPYEALREAIINAVTHRDYTEKGANIMVEMYDDRIVIHNPGGLVKGLSEKEFGRKSRTRNGVIASLFQRIGYVERMGTGIEKIKRLIKEAGLRRPKFEFTDFFTITFFRPERLGEKMGDRLGEKLGEKFVKKFVKKFGEKFVKKFGDKFGENRVVIIDLILENPKITIKKIAKELNISSRAVDKHIKFLKEEGYIKRIGSLKGGHWEVVE